MNDSIKSNYAHLAGLPPDDPQYIEFHKILRNCVRGCYFTNYASLQPGNERCYELPSDNINMLGLRLPEEALGLMKFLNSDDLDVLEKELPPKIHESLRAAVDVEKYLSRREIRSSMAQQENPAKRF